MPYIGKKPENIIATAIDSTTGDFSGVVTANAGIKVDNITIDGSEIDFSSGSFTVDVNENIIFDSDTGIIKLADGGTNFGQLDKSGNNLRIISSISNGDIVFRGDDDGSGVDALTLDMSDAGTATFNHDVILGDNSKIKLGASTDLQIYHDGSHSYIDEQGQGSLFIRGANTVDLITADGTEYMARFQVDGYNKLYHNGLERLETTSGGVTLTGTNTDGLRLTNSNNSDAISLFVRGGNAISSTSDDAVLNVGSRSDNSIITTGNVGIGTSSPAYSLHLHEASSGSNYLLITNSTTGSASNDGLVIGLAADETALIYHQESSAIRFGTASTERMRITSGGNVGINNSSPSVTLDVVDSRSTSYNATGDQRSLAMITARNPSDATNRFASINLVNGGGTQAEASINLVQAGNYIGHLTFKSRTGGSTWAERMRIDSSGNLLVGVTSTTTPGVGNTTEGVSIRGSTSSASSIFASRATASAGYFNINADGSILSLRKSGSEIGFIGTSSGDLTIGTGDTGLKFQDATDSIFPQDNLSGRDNAIDLGNASFRFDDIRATNGTIQTSDQNEKNTITDSDLGIDFIKRLTPKSYIFNGKTRTHYGLIAQDVETVLSDISKPTSGFAGFIKSDISEEQDGSEYRYGLRYTEFVAPLIQAVKDQQATIDALTARIVTLENA